MCSESPSETVSPGSLLLAVPPRPPMRSSPADCPDFRAYHREAPTRLPARQHSHWSLKVHRTLSSQEHKCAQFHATAHNLRSLWRLFSVSFPRASRELQRHARLSGINLHTPHQPTHLGNKMISSPWRKFMITITLLSCSIYIFQ